MTPSYHNLWPIGFQPWPLKLTQDIAGGQTEEYIIVRWKTYIWWFKIFQKIYLE